MRVALSNQVRALGENIGLNSPEQRDVAVMADGIAELEQAATRMVERAMRSHPLYLYVKSQRGLGDKQMGRLLAVLGDPYWHSKEERPRTVGELWAYCGYHVISQPWDETQRRLADNNGATSAILGAQAQFRTAGVAPHRRKHERANWNDAARMRAHLVAESCVKQPAGTRYRDVYDAARAKYREAAHAVTCVRCGPKGKPALIGSPLSLGHQHARGLRAVAKEILRDLWIESKRLSEVSAADHKGSESHRPAVNGVSLLIASYGLAAD